MTGSTTPPALALTALRRNVPHPDMSGDEVRGWNAALDAVAAAAGVDLQGAEDVLMDHRWHAFEHQCRCQFVGEPTDGLNEDDTIDLQHWAGHVLRMLHARRERTVAELEAGLRAAMGRVEADARARGAEYASIDELLTAAVPVAVGLPGQVAMSDLRRVLESALHYSLDGDEGECMDGCSGCAADRVRTALGMVDGEVRS